MMKLCFLFRKILSLFSTSDSSYDAVRRTGWSNNMHSGKGENTVIIPSFLFLWKMPDCEGKGLLMWGTWLFCAHENTDPESLRHQMMLKQRLHAAFDPLKSWQKIPLLTLSVCPSEPWCSQHTSWEQSSALEEERCLSAVTQPEMATFRWQLGSSKI